MNVGGSKNGPQGEINVTPLIDIVLVLLIIFMVMTPVMLKELVANVPRKQTENMPQPPGDNPIIVELSDKDVLSLNGEPLAPEALAAEVAGRLAHDRQKVVFFKVDDKANYGRTVKIMDICKGAGARTLGIITKDETSAPSSATEEATTDDATADDATPTKK
jgi:biopolymer transport protein ExbD